MRSLVAIWLSTALVLLAGEEPHSGYASYRDEFARQEGVRMLLATETANRRAAAAEARRRGIPERILLPDGRIQEIVDLRDGRLLYRTTHNANAAISAAAKTAPTAI